jgi:hypothetical protein
VPPADVPPDDVPADDVPNGDVPDGAFPDNDGGEAGARAGQFGSGGSASNPNDGSAGGGGCDMFNPFRVKTFCRSATAQAPGGERVCEFEFANWRQKS